MELAAQEIVAVADTLDEREWQLPSAATGWSVKDVVLHGGCLLGDLMAAVNGEELPDMGIEALNDVEVAEKRGCAGRQAAEFFQQQLAKALTTFSPLQNEPMASVDTQMLDLGAYPLHAIVDMFTFDMTTHLRYDMLKPRGPIDYPLPPLGETQLGPSVSWLLGGISRMQAELPQSVAAPLALHLTGPAATQVIISAVDGSISVTPQTEAELEAAATMTSSTSDFLAWSTSRLPWEPLVSIAGDKDAAQRFLNALNLT
jgi:hypothetical protein